MAYTSPVSPVTMNWQGRIGAIHAVLADARLRRLDVRQRVAYSNIYALPLVMHLAQVIPCPAGVAQQIGKAINSFLRGGNLFTVPLERLCRPHAEGGLALLHHRWKPLSMFVGMWESAARAAEQQFTGAWLRTLQQLYERPEDVPVKVAYFKVFLEQKQKLLPLLRGKDLARNIYNSLLEENQPPPLRVETSFPLNDWTVIWANANARTIPPHLRAKWYSLIQDVIPTRERLYRKKLVDSPLCTRCGSTDTLLHRLVQCDPSGSEAWQGCAKRISALLNVTPNSIQPYLLLRPDIFSPEKQELVAEDLCRTAVNLHQRWCTGR